MKNLEQIRARNAMKAAEEIMPGRQGGEVIKKIPPLIMNHGLLATGAYALDAGAGYVAAMNAIAEHLADPSIALLPKQHNSVNGLMKFLTTEASSIQLRQCTVEAMAWLTYARRFIKKSESNNKGDKQ